jgi:arsenate reductase
MQNVKIWHNPRCSKSRSAAALLEEKGVDAEVVKYLETPPTKKELKEMLTMLGISARELMRTKEDIYKELGLKEVEDEEKLIEAMVANPKLIERPIVIKDGKAAIGRPIENIIALLDA